jgi:hypothetical protein
MSEIQKQYESVLVADCGSTTTKVVLLDTVDGQYRFVAFAEAPSTIGAPWEDVSLGIVQALGDLQRVTGRRFLDQEHQLITPEQEDGSGVDLFLAVSSACEPLRVILVGLTRDYSLDSARRAAWSTYTEIVDLIALEQDVARDRPRTDNDKIQAIWSKSPDVILMSGGTDGGAATSVLEMTQNVVRVALYLMGRNAAQVIYAGNKELRERVMELLGKVAQVRVVDNVRPLPEVENIGPASEEVEVALYGRKMSMLPGVETLGAWGAGAVLPTARAFDYAVRYLEQRVDGSRGALGIDIGSASVTISVCRDGHPLTIVRSDLGVGYGARGLLEKVDVGDITRWLPYGISESQVRDRLLNKGLYPHTIPQTREDLALEQAVAREALRLAVHDSLPGWPGCSEGGSPGRGIPPCDPIVLGGGVFRRIPYHGHAVLILLDVLGPAGVSRVYLDEYDLLPTLGMAATVEPLALVQTVGSGGLAFLGTVVVPTGPVRPGEKVLTIRSLDGEAAAEFDVADGDLSPLPVQSLAVGTMLELSPAQGIDVGAGPGRSLHVEYEGGTVGLVVDARGRPLAFDDDPEVQRQRMERWLWGLMNI